VGVGHWGFKRRGEGVGLRGQGDEGGGEIGGGGEVYGVRGGVRGDGGEGGICMGEGCHSAK
jgi:hypothetical protein